MSLIEGMNLEAGATGKDIAQVQKAPLDKRLVMAPVGLVAAEIGAQLGIYAENLLADFFAPKDKKGQSDDGWRTKVLLGKCMLAVLLYPLSVPLALGFSASGGLLHWLMGLATFGECEDQAKVRARQLRILGENPRGRYTRPSKGKGGEDAAEGAEEDTEEKDSEDKAQAQQTDIDLAAKLTDPDVLDVYGKAADLAWERLIQQGHLPVGIKPVINEAMVQQVQHLVREAQRRGTA